MTEINNSAVVIEQVQTDFTALQRGYRSLPYPTVEQRKARLSQLLGLVVENEAAICQAISDDFGGRAVVETQTAEILPSVMGIKDARKHLKSWMRSSHKFIPLVFQPALAKVISQPVGVVGIIVPWNYPLYLAIGPLIAALAAGNVAYIKMSEFTPKLGYLLADLLPKYLDPSVVRLVNGDVEVAQAFSSLPFDHLLFTGSTRVGKHIMRAASQNLTPVTLELGGKSPVVIDRSIPVREAAARLVYPKCLNAGQTCVAPDYVLCPEESVDEFVQHFLVEAKRQFGEIAKNDDFTAIVNERQRSRLLGYINEAVAAGATLYIAGASDDLASYGNKLPPMLLTNVPAHCAVLQDEIFGPILPIVAYQKLSDTVDYINARPRPLALYVFGYDKALVELFEQQTHSGGLMFNEALIYVAMDNLPFGGIGASGMGQYHGVYGFQTLSKLKPVVRKGRFSSLKLVYPPYKGWLMSTIMRLFGR